MKSHDHFLVKLIVPRVFCHFVSDSLLVEMLTNLIRVTIVIILLDGTNCFSNKIPLNTVSDSVNLQYVNDLQRLGKPNYLMLDQIFAEMETKVKANFFNGRRTSDSPEAKGNSRARRAILHQRPNLADITILRGAHSAYELEASSVISDLAYIQTSKNVYLVGAGGKNMDGSTGQVKSYVWVWNEENIQGYRILATIELPGAIGVEGFVINDEAYFIFAINIKDNHLDYLKRLSKLYKIDAAGKIIHVHSFSTFGSTIWKSFEADGKVYLIQADYIQWMQLKMLHRDYSNIMMPKGSNEVRLFQWTDTAFLQVGLLSASHSTAVDATSINGRNLLAIVNQTIEEGNVHSTVLIYEISNSIVAEMQIRLVQRIVGWAVSDIKLVHVGSHLFLAIAYEYRVIEGMKTKKLNSIILRYNGLVFVEYQRITTSCALKWTPLIGSKGQVALHLQSAYEQNVYQFIDDSWIAIPVAFPWSPAIDGSLMKMKSFVHFDNNVAALASAGKVQFAYLEFVPESLQSVTDEMLVSCAFLMKRIDGLSQYRQLGFDRQLASRRMEQLLEGEIEFQNVDIWNLHLENVKVRQTRVFDHVLRNRLAKIETKFSTLPDNLSNYLKSTTQTIRNDLVINNIWIDELITNKINVNDVNGVTFCKFLPKVVQFRADSEVPIQVTNLHFEQAVFNNAVNISGRLNAIKIPEDIVHLNRPNHFTATKSFQHGIHIKSDLKVKGTVNDIRPENILLVHGKQVIQSNTIIHGNVHVVNIELTIDTRVNNITWSEFVNETVLIDEPVVLVGEKTFQSDVIIHGDLIPHKLVSGVDLKKLFLNAIPLNTTVFESEVTFHDVTFDRDVSVIGTVNDVKIPGDLILLKRSEPVWEMELEMHSPLRVEKIVVNGLINGQKIDSQNVMTKHGRQEITGLKTFGNVDVEPQIKITGFVNGDNLTELIRRVQPRLVNADASYRKLTVKNLVVHGKLPEDLRRLLYDSVKRYENYTFPGHTIFTKTTTFEHNLDLPQVVFEHLVPVESTKIVYLNTKILHDVDFEHNIVVEGLINGVDLKSFTSNILTTTGFQVVRQPKYFKNVVIKKNLFVQHTINNINLVNAVKINEPVNIRGRMRFGAPVVVYESTMVDRVIIRNTLNQQPAMQWFQDTLLIDEVQNITAPKIFIGGVNVGEKVVVQKNIDVKGSVYLNGAKLNEFVEDVVLVDNRVNIILGTTVFNSTVDINEVHTVVVDNVNIEDLFKNGLKYNEQRCPKFTSQVKIQHLTVGIVNDHDMKKFFDNVVYINDTTLDGLLHFHNVITSSITMTGFVNGIKFADEVITTSSTAPIVVLGEKTFTNSLKINHIELSGTVNGVDFVKLDQNAMKHGIDQIIYGTLRVDNLHVKGSSFVGGSIAGINLTDFMNRAWFVDEDVIVHRPVVFHNLIHKAAYPHMLKVTGSIDGIDIEYPYKNMVRIDDRAQVILGRLKFHKNVTFHDIKAANITLGPQSLVNKIKLQHWDTTIMKINKPQKVLASKTFLNEITVHTLHVTGMVNEINSADIMTLKGDQRIYDMKTFTKVTVTNLQVTGLLMNVDVRTWYEKAILRDQPMEIRVEGRKDFSTMTFVTDVAVDATIDGKKTSTFVTVNSPQTITGPKTFESEIVIPRWTHEFHLYGEVNNVPQSFPELIHILLMTPLPYPCDSDYVYYKGGCYQVRDAVHVECEGRSEPLVIFNQLDKELMQKMNLVENGDIWIISHADREVTVCFRKASLHTIDAITLTGNFTFNSTVTTVALPGAPYNLVTPLQRQYDAAIVRYLLQKDDLHRLTSRITTDKNGMCKDMQDLNNVFLNAYRPLGELNTVQTPDSNVLKLIPVNLASTNGVMSFLAVGPDFISLYQWQSSEFGKVKQFETSWLNGLSGEIKSFQDSDGNVVLLIPKFGNCPNNLIRSVEVLYISNLSRLTVLEPITTNECVPVSSVQVATIGGIHFALIAFDVNNLQYLRWDEKRGFGQFLGIYERFPIYYVKPIDYLGNVLVVSGYNGLSLITLYHVDVNVKYASALTSLHDLPDVEHILEIVDSTGIYVLLSTNRQLQLLEYEPRTRRFKSKQIVSTDFTITKVFWVPEMKWIIVTSCCENSKLSTFNGYLDTLKPINIKVLYEPIVFDRDTEVYIVIQHENRKLPLTSILKGRRYGPTIRNECPLSC